ncbi:MAG TPA: nuclear transport factor 2 family protein [Flavitalea sp.]|nr:nuclear transport factor 2 family protein [Flavitalea sp.]
MQTMEATAQSTLNHHLEAFGKNDLHAIMEDYSEESEVWTPEGIIAGREAIESFFKYAFTLFPKESTRFNLQKLLVKENRAYITWDAESDVVNVPYATDSFEIEDGTIIWQTTAFQMINK